MNGYHIDSRRTRFARGFKDAAAAIVIGLIVVAGSAANDELSTVTKNYAAANAVVATATNYFPSPYVLNATEATPHIVAMTAICSAAMLLFACASTPQLEVPAALKPSANESLAMIVAAKGVQIYECRARRDAAAGHEWVSVAPEAELFDTRGRLIGRHDAGPHWQASDGSRILGKVKARAEAPVAGAIPWLLLAATTVGPEGSFSKVTSIQRVNTVGGLAPASGCTGDTAGMPARIHYAADYHFFSVR